VTAPSPPHRAGYIAAVIASVFAGLGVAVQSRINGELGLALGNGSLAAVVSFGSGLVLLLAALIFWRPGRVGFGHLFHALREKVLPWWSIFGGVAGALFVLSQGLFAGVIGVALFIVAVVTGQTLGAVIIDSNGLFGARRVALTPTRLGGAVTVLAGVVVATTFWSDAAVTVGWSVSLPLVSGMLVGWQQAVNGRVKRVAQSSLTATALNFFVGTVVLVLVLTVSLFFDSFPEVWPTAWWLYAGGALGAVFIAVQVITVNKIGVLALGVSLITGQILGSLALDVFFPVAQQPFGWWTVVGATLVLLGSALVTLTTRRRESG
jgi:bacterial/archaeal transporter family-2 protein